MMRPGVCSPARHHSPPWLTGHPQPCPGLEGQSSAANLRPQPQWRGWAGEGALGTPGEGAWDLPGDPTISREQREGLVQEVALRTPDPGTSLEEGHHQGTAQHLAGVRNWGSGLPDPRCVVGSTWGGPRKTVTTDCINHGILHTGLQRPHRKPLGPTFLQCHFLSYLTFGP